MNVCHVISSISLSSGGPSKSICDLALEQTQKEFSVQIISLKTENPYFTKSPHKNLNLFFLEKNEFKSSLKQIIKDKKSDILHGHGLWLLEVHQMASIAQKLNLPYIISPRGMLEPWALNYKKWKKLLAMFLYQKKDLSLASCIHATSLQEAEHIRNLGFKNPIAVIPNPVELKNKIEKVHLNKRRLAFMGRIHKIKNIESLLKAWSSVSNKENWELLIVGDGDISYVKSLKQLIDDLHITSTVVFTGFLTGKEKENIMHTIDIVVLPSFSENFGMVVGEALQNEIPVIASTATPWEDLNTHQCGWWVKNDIETLTQTIQQAISLSNEERMLMGQRGRKLIEERYSIDIVTKQMIELYKWLINQKNPKPEFIYE